MASLKQSLAKQWKKMMIPCITITPVFKLEDDEIDRMLISSNNAVKMLEKELGIPFVLNVNTLICGKKRSKICLLGRCSEKENKTKMDNNKGVPD